MWLIIAGAVIVAFGMLWIWVMENMEIFNIEDPYDKEPEDFLIDKRDDMP
jgi:hypothetical protein